MSDYLFQFEQKLVKVQQYFFLHFFSILKKVKYRKKNTFGESFIIRELRLCFSSNFNTSFEVFIVPAATITLSNSNLKLLFSLFLQINVIELSFGTISSTSVFLIISMSLFYFIYVR